METIPYIGIKKYECICLDKSIELWRDPKKGLLVAFLFNFLFISICFSRVSLITLFFYFCIFSFLGGIVVFQSKRTPNTSTE